MRLSTRARYGLRAMIELSHDPEGAAGHVIAKNQCLPAAYLEQILARLRRAKLVSSVRGARGKFMLTGEAKSITLSQILEADQGAFSIDNCEDVAHCHDNPDSCVIQRVYSEANQLLYDYFNNITLAELADQQTDQQNNPVLDYSI